LSPLPAEIAGRAVVRSEPVGGGDINDAFRVELEGGGEAFVKTRDGAQPGEYATEAAGLRWLGDGGALVPEVLEAADGFLALEWLDEGRLSHDGEEELGRRLAQMHRAGAETMGAPGGAWRIGPIVLRDDPTDIADWPSFYAAQRLVPLAERAGLQSAIEPVTARIEEIAGPAEPPARLHGDLWSGNVLASDGRPYLIDPAAYGGHREIDLAMLQLFGSPSQRTLEAYDEVWPRADGHEERVGLYQLLPLLVHAILFGGSYVASVERTARRYG
jgi:fructosamine-3-kinase